MPLKSHFFVLFIQCFVCQCIRRFLVIIVVVFLGSLFVFDVRQSAPAWEASN